MQSEGPYRAFGPDDDARLRPLALERSARLKGGQICFVCSAPVVGTDKQGRTTYVVPPTIAIVNVGLMLRPPVCGQHPRQTEWPAADYELAVWMAQHGWGEPIDPTLLGDVH